MKSRLLSFKREHVLTTKALVLCKGCPDKRRGNNKENISLELDDGDERPSLFFFEKKEIGRNEKERKGMYNTIQHNDSVESVTKLESHIT